MDRAALKEYILKQYNVEPDCPWPKHPNFEVFRHAGNQKWFALAMEVPKGKLGLRENGTLDVVNFKCDPILICAMKNEPGIFPAYHMNKEKWLTAALDARVPDDTMKLLLAMSYEAMPGKLCSKRKGAAFNWCVA